MYIVNDELPKSCMRCPYASKCNVWSTIIEQMDEEQFMDFPTPQPMQYPCCKIITAIPNKIIKFYRKWIKGLCPHICILCKHKKECDIFNGSN